MLGDLAFGGLFLAAFAIVTSPRLADTWRWQPLRSVLDAR